ncbi:hypothetical protein KQ51_00952 [Candidatus Izimaplasma bacterium HR1]|jgi:hypothetical protein|uniref:hypothetical protein n=1 Tax=Candidatus Izimoplasma sp. HR1 TaxID=1541959 RepID=UPI0004F6C5C3|nr:hypothetical protein KQ51_00952 [Candidatus Izimaplasma bacterium HR1]
MHKKIREYVDFKLKSDHSEDHEEKKEEIISNIIDRYDELYEKTKDKSYSYVEAIKTFGDFPADSTDEDSYKPLVAEMFLVSATVISVISLIVTLLSGVAGAIVVGISITLYAVGAVYLYQYSKFIQREEYDIQKYTSFIDKVFSYMKTNFVFWAISLSLIFTRMIYGIVVLFATVMTMDTLGIEDFYGIITFSVIGFLIVFAIIGSLFIGLYRRLIKKYTDLSGNNDVKSIGLKAKEFITHNYTQKKNIFLRKWFYPVLHLIISLILLIDINVVSDSSEYEWYVLSRFFIIENLIIICLYLLLTILIVLGKIKYHLLIPIINILISVIVFIVWIALESTRSISSVNGPIFFFVGIVFILLFIIDFNLNRKIK